VKRYSSGMHARWALVAAHMEFDILVIDEVLSVGDLRSVEGPGKNALSIE
jgi:ABC-type polysaccharide/polyol phosphate transport system ATPase subunit